MNKGIIKDLDYVTYGNITILEEQKYFKGTLCRCWCDCGNFLNVDKEKLLSGMTNCSSPIHNNTLIDQKISKKRNRKIKDKPLARVVSRYKSLKHGCKITKRIVSLTLEDYLEFAKSNECHDCGEFIDWFSKSSAYYLDRKDNSVDYTKENCVVCCTRCNMAKGNRFTYEEWAKIGAVIRLFKK